MGAWRDRESSWETCLMTPGHTALSNSQSDLHNELQHGLNALHHPLRFPPHEHHAVSGLRTALLKELDGGLGALEERKKRFGSAQESHNLYSLNSHQCLTSRSSLILAPFTPMMLPARLWWMSILSSQSKSTPLWCWYCPTNQRGESNVSLKCTHTHKYTYTGCVFSFLLFLFLCIHWSYLKKKTNKNWV